MATERELIIRLKLDNKATPELEKFKRGLDDLGSSAENFSSQASSSFGEFRTNFNAAFGDFGKSIDSVESLKSTLGGLAGSFAAAGFQETAQFVADSVVNFVDYERALTDVARTTGYSKEQTADLGEALRDLSTNELQGQVLADDLANIAEAAGSLGITAKSDILAFTRSVAEISSATGLAYDTTADKFSKIAGVFQESLEKPRVYINEFGQAITKDFGSAYTQIGNIGSAFDKLADDTKGSIEGIMTRVQYMGGMATTLGLTVDQTAALAAVMESVGLSAEKGSTAAKKFMSELLTNSDNFANALSINGAKLKDAIAKDPMEGIQMVLEGMAKLKQEKGPAELVKVMEQLLGTGDGVKEFATKMSGATEDLKKATDSAATAFNEGTRASESFKQAADTTVGSWTSIKTSIDDVSKSLGQQLKPAVDGASGLLADFTVSVAGAFRKESVDSFFDGVVDGFAELSSANLTDWLRAIPTAAAQTVVDLNPILNGGITDLMGGIAEIVGAGDWFAGMLTNANQVMGEIDAAFSGWMSSLGSSIFGFFSDVETKSAKSAASLKALQTQFKVPAEAEQSAVSYFQQLEQLDKQFGIVANGSDALYDEYYRVFDGLKAAMSNNVAPSQDLIAQFEAMREEIKAVGVEAYGHSTFKDMPVYIDGTTTSTQTLTDAMDKVRASVKQLEADYKATNASEDASSARKKANIQAIENQIRALKAEQDSAWGSRREQLDEEINALQRQKATASDVSTSRKADLDAIKQKLDAEKDTLKELEQAQKEVEKAEKVRADAVEFLAKNTERTAELRQQQLEEAQRLENELYQERQQQAADSIKWIESLSDAGKKRLMGEEDAVKILQEQGVTLTDLQAQEVRRLQGAYKTEQAYEAQAKALAAQLDPMGALIAAGESLSGSLGSLSSGIGDIGDLFGFDTSGIEGFLGKMQGFAQLPGTIKGITDSIGGIGQALGGLGNIGSSLSGIFGSLTGVLGGGGLAGALGSLGGAVSGAVGGLGSMLGGLGGLATAAGPVGLAIAGIGGAIFGLTKLFQDTTSAGTEAAKAFQDFVAKNVTGGAELSAALQTNFDAMSQANFDYQAFLTQTGTTMDQVFGGMSANWESGSTAMDIFTQAVGRATGDMGKAPQVALQMMASFQDMGMSAEQAGAKMLEIAKASGMDAEQLAQLEAALGSSDSSLLAASGAAEQLTGSLSGTTSAASSAMGSADSFTAALQSLQSTGDITQTQMDALSASFAGAGSDSTGAAGNVEGLRASLDAMGVSGKDADALIRAFGDSLGKIPKEVSVKVKINQEGEIPKLADGGFASGLVQVGERGMEIADYRQSALGSGWEFIGKRGPEFRVVPDQTRIVPHHKLSSFLTQMRQTTIPGAATGGTVQVTQQRQAAQQPTSQVIINAAMLNDATVREAELRLKRLERRRARA